MNATQEKSNQRSFKAKRYFGCRFWMTLAMFVGFGIWWMSTPTPESRPVGPTEEFVTVTAEKPSDAEIECKRREAARAMEAEKLKLEEEKYKSDIRRRTALFQSNVEAAYERFVKQIPFADAQSSLDAARAGTTFLASGDGLCGYKALSGMAYRLAWDKFKNTNTFEDLVNPPLERHVMTHVKDAVEVYKTKMVSFQRELECEMTAYRADLLLKAREFKDFTSGLKVLDSETIKDVNDRLSVFDSQAKEMATKTVFTSIGVVMEAVFLKSTIAAAKTVGKRVIAPFLAKTVARLSASYAAGAGAAVADGPFPVGDVVGVMLAVGGTAWMAYDIYKLMDVLPNELERNLCAFVNEIDAGLRENAAEQAKKMPTEMKKWSDEQTKGL